jgi:hypothetical protein
MRNFTHILNKEFDRRLKSLGFKEETSLLQYIERGTEKFNKYRDTDY